MYMYMYIYVYVYIHVYVYVYIYYAILMKILMIQWKSLTFGGFLYIQTSILISRNSTKINELKDLNSKYIISWVITK